MEEGLISRPLLEEEAKILSCKGVVGNSSSSSSSSATSAVIFSVLVVTCGTFAYGCGYGYLSPAQSGIMEDLGLSTSEYSVFGSILTIGGMLGAILSGKIADLFGRRGTMWIYQGFCITGWLAIIFAKGAWWLDLGRLSLGIGYGIYCYLAPVYVAEITPKDIRGACIATFQLAACCGLSLMFFIGNFIHWRTLAIIAIVPCLVQVVGIFFIPESPRWLAKIGREKEVEAILRRLRGKYADTSQEAAEIKLVLGYKQQEMKRVLVYRITQIFVRASQIGVGLILLVQYGGTNGISYYASSVFEVAGCNVSVGTTTMAMIQLPFSALSVQLIDRFGRRPLLMVTATGAFLGSLLAGMAFLLQDIHQQKEVTSIVVLSGILLYSASYSMGLVSVPFLLMSEIFPINIKGQAGSLLALANWFSSWIVSYTFNFLYEWSSAGVFLIYATVCLSIIIFTSKMVPETKGRTLEEIQASLI